MTPNTSTSPGRGPSPAGVLSPIEEAEVVVRQLLREDSRHQYKLWRLLNYILLTQGKPEEYARRSPDGKPNRT